MTTTQHPAPSTSLLGITSEQVQQLLSLLQPSPSGLSSLVGNFSSPTWLIYSGALHHMTGNMDFLSSIRDVSPSPVGLPNGLQTNAIKADNVQVALGIVLRHVLNVPHLTVNLISVSRLATDADCCLVFFHDICVL